MALDKDVATLLRAMSEQGLRSFEQLSVAEARQVVSTFVGLQAPPQDVAEVWETTYLSDGLTVPLSVYVPDGNRPHPVVLYFHGGGFVAGDLAVVDEPARSVANGAEVIVVTASYRRAPEYRFPTAVEDCWAALGWVVDNVARYGGDPQNIVLMGDSAGGNLAAVTALQVRDHGVSALRGQILIYPIIDPAADFPSRGAFAAGPLLTGAGLDWFWQQYLNGPEDAKNPYAVPTNAARFDGLPPTLLLTTENEVCRDEAEHYGDLLRDSGVHVRSRRFDGLIHGVFWMSAAVPRSVELLSEIVSFIASTSHQPR